MGWLIEQFFDEVLSQISARIYRTAGWVGCVVVLLVLAAIVALLIFLIWLLARG